MRKRCALGFHFLIICSSRIKLASHSLSRFQQQPQPPPRLCNLSPYWDRNLRSAAAACMCAWVCRQFQSVVALLAVNDSLSVNSSGSECKCPCAHHRVHVPASAKPWIYFSWQPLKPYAARPDDHYSCMGILNWCLFTPRRLLRN